MATIVAKKAIKRKAGYLYFVDGEGNVKETKMNRKGGKKGRKVCSLKKAKPATKKAVKKAAPKKKPVAKKTATKKRVVKKAATKKRATKKTTKKSTQLSLFKSR